MCGLIAYIVELLKSFLELRDTAAKDESSQGKGFGANRPREEWGIDLSKLEFKNLVVHGTYGSMYQGTYDDQDVAGTCLFLLILARNIYLLSCNPMFIKTKGISVLILSISAYLV